MIGVAGQGLKTTSQMVHDQKEAIRSVGGAEVGRQREVQRWRLHEPLSRVASLSVSSWCRNIRTRLRKSCMTRHTDPRERE